MLYKKIKEVSPWGFMFTFYIVIQLHDTPKCLDCKTKFKPGNGVLCTFKTFIPRDGNLAEGIELKFDGGIYCLKCAEKNKRLGMKAIISDIIIKEEEDNGEGKNIYYQDN